MPKYHIFTDGACSNNPGIGGWAFIIKSENGDIIEKSGGCENTTNNRMELKSVIEALKEIKEHSDVIITSDSKYVVDSVEKGWLYTWDRIGWKRKDGSNTINMDLWKECLNLLKKHNVKFEWVRGHSGHKENERCDELSKIMVKKLASK